MVNMYAPPIAAARAVSAVLSPKFISPGLFQSIPKMPMVLPERVKTPHAPVFCFVSVFWIVLINNPAPPVTATALTACPNASFG